MLSVRILLLPTKAVHGTYRLRPIPVLGALSKVLATIATHPLIVAKTMLQSKPPPQRRGRPFRGFTEVLVYIVKHEGVLRLYKGLVPQIVKGFIVQGLMMMLKERSVFSFRISASFFIDAQGQDRIPDADATFASSTTFVPEFVAQGTT
jgi:hypothetical protein